MNLEDDEIIRQNTPPQLQEQEQPSWWSRLVDKYFVRLKTIYCNREYAIVFLGIIGITISWNLFILYPYTVKLYMKEQNKIHTIHTSDYNNCSSYKNNGYFIGLIPGGILATVYPAHKILGVSVFLFSISHLILLMCVAYLSCYVHCFIQFYISMAMATIILSIHGILAYLIPLKKQSIRHVPLILCWLILNGGYIRPHTFHEHFFFYFMTTLIGFIGLLWYVFWLYAFNVNRRQRLNLQYSSNLPDIPWKSFYTSKPLLAIALLYACDAQLNQTIGVFNNNEVSEWRNYTIIVLLIFIVVTELIPEITVSTPTISVRKIWSCSYFSTMGVNYFLKAYLDNSVKTNKTILFHILKEMKYLYIFGFYLNHLDIAPKYASILYSLLLTINWISNCLWDYIVNYLFSSWILRNEVETGFMTGTICFAVAVFYAIFASAEVQPWAADDPVEENRQVMVEINNLNNLPYYTA